MRQDEALAASLAREKQLESLVKQLQSAIVAKDEMIWRLAVGTPQLPSQLEPTGAPSEAPACSVPAPASAAPSLEPRGSDKWSLRWLSNPPVRAVRKRSRAPGATTDESEATLCRSLPVRRRGTLTKLSKGGFTANWNRRVFVLIGASLFYERDWPQLMMQPKLFVRLKASHVRPLARTPARTPSPSPRARFPSSRVAARAPRSVRVRWSPRGRTRAAHMRTRSRLLTESSPRARRTPCCSSPPTRRTKGDLPFSAPVRGARLPRPGSRAPLRRAAWIDAMTIARADPPCPARLVAQMLSMSK